MNFLYEIFGEELSLQQPQPDPSLTLTRMQCPAIVGNAGQGTETGPCRAAGYLCEVRVRGLGRRHGDARGAEVGLRRLEAGHWPMVSAPEALVAFLAEATSERG